MKKAILLILVGIGIWGMVCGLLFLIPSKEKAENISQTQLAAVGFYPATQPLTIFPGNNFLADPRIGSGNIWISHDFETQNRPKMDELEEVGMNAFRFAVLTRPYKGTGIGAAEAVLNEARLRGMKVYISANEDDFVEIERIASDLEEVRAGGEIWGAMLTRYNDIIIGVNLLNEKNLQIGAWLEDYGLEETKRRAAVFADVNRALAQGLRQGGYTGTISHTALGTGGPRFTPDSFAILFEPVLPDYASGLFNALDIHQYLIAGEFRIQNDGEIWSAELRTPTAQKLVTFFDLTGLATVIDTQTLPIYWGEVNVQENIGTGNRMFPSHEAAAAARIAYLIDLAELDQTRYLNVFSLWYNGQYEIIAGEPSGNSVYTIATALGITHTLPPPLPPVAVDDNATLSVNEARVIDVLANDYDSQRETTITLTGVGTPTGGTVESIDTKSGLVMYRAPSTSGSYLFSYTISNGQGSSTGYVHITVNPGSSGTGSGDGDGDGDGDDGGSQLSSSSSDPTGSSGNTGFSDNSAPETNFELGDTQGEGGSTGSSAGGKGEVILDLNNNDYYKVAEGWHPFRSLTQASEQTEELLVGKNNLLTILALFSLGIIITIGVSYFRSL